MDMPIYAFSKIVTMAVWRRFGEEAANPISGLSNSVVPVSSLCCSVRSTATGFWIQPAVGRLAIGVLFEAL